MASINPHRSPSAGSVIKKMLEINPELGVKELSVLIREAVEKCADFEIIDEEKALRLAREFSRD